MALSCPTAVRPSTAQQELCPCPWGDACIHVPRTSGACTSKPTHPTGSWRVHPNAFTVTSVRYLSGPSANILRERETPTLKSRGTKKRV